MSSSDIPQSQTSKGLHDGHPGIQRVQWLIRSERGTADGYAPIRPFRGHHVQQGRHIAPREHAPRLLHRAHRDHRQREVLEERGRPATVSRGLLRAPVARALEEHGVQHGHERFTGARGVFGPVEHPDGHVEGEARQTRGVQRYDLQERRFVAFVG